MEPLTAYAIITVIIIAGFIACFIWYKIGCMTGYDDGFIVGHKAGKTVGKLEALKRQERKKKV